MTIDSKALDEAIKYCTRLYNDSAAQRPEGVVPDWLTIILAAQECQGLRGELKIQDDANDILTEQNDQLRAEIASLKGQLEGKQMVINQLEVEIASLRKQNEWQPIETAPRDGTYILVTRCPATTRPPISKVSWSAGRARIPAWRIWNGATGRLGYGPTHWMPLPQPPKVKE